MFREFAFVHRIERGLAYACAGRVMLYMMIEAVFIRGCTSSLGGASGIRLQPEERQDCEKKRTPFWRPLCFGAG